MSFEIKQLRYAVAAADHGSFYRAARALDVEQSTLSRNIVKLERAVGAKLFHRSRAGVAPTIIGSLFIRSARAMVANADRMVAHTRAGGQGRAGSLIVGHNNSVAAGYMRATIVAWQEHSPEVHFESVESDRGALLAQLDTGEIDIAILIGNASHEGFRREVFWSERILVAVPALHWLAEREVVHWTDLGRERFVLPKADPGPDIRDMLLGRLSQSGTPPDIRFSQTSREIVLSLLGTGKRLSVVCEGSTGVRYPDVVYRPLHGEQGPTLTTYSGYWREENCNPVLKRFLDFVHRRYALSFRLSDAASGSNSKLEER